MLVRKEKKEEDEKIRHQKSLPESLEWAGEIENTQMCIRRVYEIFGCKLKRAALLPDKYSKSLTETFPSSVYRPVSYHNFFFNTNTI